MKKLELKLDELRVESFDTAAAAHETRGTVRGHVNTDSCPGLSCAVTCGMARWGAALDQSARCNTFQFCCV
jgi:hypothetical protein